MASLFSESRASVSPAAKSSRSLSELSLTNVCGVPVALSSIQRTVFTLNAPLPPSVIHLTLPVVTRSEVRSEDLSRSDGFPGVFRRSFNIFFVGSGCLPANAGRKNM